MMFLFDIIGAGPDALEVRSVLHSNAEVSFLGDLAVEGLAGVDVHIFDLDRYCANVRLVNDRNKTLAEEGVAFIALQLDLLEAEIDSFSVAIDGQSLVDLSHACAYL